MLGFEQYDPRVHRVLSPDPELLSWCKRQPLPDELRESLFVFRHADTDNFVLARWICEKWGLLKEIFCIGKSLADFTHARAGFFLDTVLCPIRCRDVLKEIRQADRDAHTFKERENAEYDDQQARCRREVA